MAADDAERLLDGEVHLVGSPLGGIELPCELRAISA